MRAIASRVPSGRARATGLERRLGLQAIMLRV